MSLLSAIKDGLGCSEQAGSFSAVVIRADGTREDRGVIAMSHPSVWVMLKWNVSQLIRGRRPGRINNGVVS